MNQSREVRIQKKMKMTMGFDSISLNRGCQDWSVGICWKFISELQGNRVISKVRETMWLDSLWVIKRLVGRLFVGRDETVGRFLEEKSQLSAPEKREEEQRVGEHHQGAA